MKALILNSGIGKRMGVLTSHSPKCMSELTPETTIVSRQLSLLDAYGIHSVVMTTGPFQSELEDYLSRVSSCDVTFVPNPIYDKTNYIYSIYCAREALRGDDILLMHGDLVFESEALGRVLESKESCMAVSSTAPLPEKDFKAVIRDGRIEKVGIEFFDSALAAQPLYLLREKDWTVWLDAICAFCERGETNCYAEKALNTVTDQLTLLPMDVKDMLCGEVDTPEDLLTVSTRTKKSENRNVYMCFSSDILHSGHLAILRRAASLGRLTVGILSDRAIAEYKRYPVVGFEERAAMMKGIKGVSRVICQEELSYQKIIRQLKPDILVHGDDWRSGVQKPIREEALAALQGYGGRMIEYPYNYEAEGRARADALHGMVNMPDIRRGRLRRLLTLKPLITVLEAHSGITGLIAEKTAVYEGGRAYQFDAMWVSSLCDSTAKGKPDIEVVDMSSRMRTIDEIMEVTTKPIILDGDTGGLTEHFVYNVRTMERTGVSAVIIEDKTGLKRNSLFGTEAEQTQDTIENFCAKIQAGCAARRTKDFLIIARVESLILEKGMEDALTRAFAYVQAGADGIMIHSRKKEPDEIFEFVEKFRAVNQSACIVVVPTSFHQVKEAEFASRGVNIVIYANQLTRSGFPAMQKTAETILRTHRAKEADDMCMSIKEILSLIPEE